MGGVKQVLAYFQANHPFQVMRDHPDAPGELQIGDHDQAFETEMVLIDDRGLPGCWDLGRDQDGGLDRVISIWTGGTGRNFDSATLGSAECCFQAG